MPSPFPGMNPYLEQEDVWHDFHERFAPLAAEVIGAQVAPRYIVKIDQHVYVHELPDEPRRFLGKPDAYIAPSGARGGIGAATAILEAPVRFLLPAIEVERQNYLEIRDVQSREVVTMIELLSPANKSTGPDREQYLGKRGAVLRSATNLVEIDLLRGGGRLPPIDLPGADYCVFVSRAVERPSACLWPIRLREPLPNVPIPLRPGDPEARLDLQALLHRIHDAAYYACYIYAGRPQPQLRPDDAEWARAFVPVP